MTCITIPDVRFVMTATGAKRPGKAGMAIVFGIDMPPAQKVFLFVTVNPGGDMPKSMRV